MTDAVSDKVVTSADRARFNRDGFLLLDSTGRGLDVLDGAIADVAELYEAEPRVHDAWRTSPNVRALALAPQIHAILAALYGRAPLPFQTLNFRKGSEQAAHSDTIHFNSQPAGYMCGVWVALEDIDMDNGPLVYYPGSHKQLEITMQDVGVAAQQDQYSHYERHVASLIERQSLEPSYGTLRKGQTLIWSANLLHGGLVQRDPARTRHSQVTHFFFEGCRYYTPMMSGDGHVEWRDPTWVSDEQAAGEDEEFEGYDAARIRAVVEESVPAGSAVAVVSGGDEALMQLAGRRALHFPRNEEGGHAGYHPADSEDALAELERLRASGVRYLLLPNASFWWLEHYTGLADALDRTCEVVGRDEHCIVFSLRRGITI